MYVYLYSQGDNLFTVGFYDPSGKWHAESDHNTREEAAARVAWLNGSGSAVMLAKVEKHIASLGLSAEIGLHEKAACLALCREIKALRQQVAR